MGTQLDLDDVADGNPLAEKELKVLRGVVEAASDFLFADSNPSFSIFCGKTANEHKELLVEKISEYHNHFEDDAT